jgi:hypothetical protein
LLDVERLWDCEGRRLKLRALCDLRSPLLRTATGKVHSRMSGWIAAEIPHRGTVELRVPILHACAIERSLWGLAVGELGRARRDHEQEGNNHCGW